MVRRSKRDICPVPQGITEIKNSEVNHQRARASTLTHLLAGSLISCYSRIHPNCCTLLQLSGEQGSSSASRAVEVPAPSMSCQGSLFESCPLCPRWLHNAIGVANAIHTLAFSLLALGPLLRSLLHILPLVISQNPINAHGALYNGLQMRPLGSIHVHVSRIILIHTKQGVAHVGTRR